MSDINTEEYKKNEIFENILKYLKFSVGLVNATVYGVDKLKNLPIVAGNASGMPDEVADVAKSTLSYVVDFFGYASYGFMVIEFFDPVFREQGKFLWMEFKKDSKEARRNFTIGTFVFVVICIGGLAYCYWSNIKTYKKLLSEKKENWKRPLSLVSNGLKFIGGIIQLITIIQNWDYYKDRKLFSFSSVILSLTAPFEMYGIDKVLYRAHPSGAVYIVVYGLRTTVQVTQAVGLLTKEN